MIPFDFHAGPDAGLPRRIHGHYALLEERHRLPVQSVIVLLLPQADLRAVAGRYERSFPGESEPYLSFRYRLIRVWKLPADRPLAGGLGVLPLALIGTVNEAELPGLIGRLKERLNAPRYRNAAGSIWTAVDVLMGYATTGRWLRGCCKGCMA